LSEEISRQSRLILKVNHAVTAAGVVIEANGEQLQVQQRQWKNARTDATQATLVEAKCSITCCAFAPLIGSVILLALSTLLRC